jgi:hypothetical protein
VNPGWRIKSWDRSLGRGLVTSEQAGDLSFDGHVALVDDFVVGEPVELELRRDNGKYVVVRLWPDDPRFVPSVQSSQHAPALKDNIERDAAGLVSKTDGLFDFRISLHGDDLLIEGDDDAFAYGPLLVLTLRDVGYIELPRMWSGKSIRLADTVERDHLATRHELTDRTIALRVVDSSRRIYFVTCEGISCRTR